MHWGDMGAWGWGGWLVAMATMLIFWAGLAVVIVVALRRPSDRRTSDDPHGILAERFARGEIDEDEYRRRRQVLR